MTAIKFSPLTLSAYMSYRSTMYQCGLCGAAVVDKVKHQNWHTDQESK